jgi:hypothetical protein
MLVMSKGALPVGQAATYYEEKYSRDDCSVWSGAGSAKPPPSWD